MFQLNEDNKKWNFKWNSVKTEPQMNCNNKNKVPNDLKQQQQRSIYVESSHIWKANICDVEWASENPTILN